MEKQRPPCLCACVVQPVDVACVRACVREHEGQKGDRVVHTVLCTHRYYTCTSVCTLCLLHSFPLF